MFLISSFLTCFSLIFTYHCYKIMRLLFFSRNFTTIAIVAKGFSINKKINLMAMLDFGTTLFRISYYCFFFLFFYEDRTF